MKGRDDAFTLILITVLSSIIWVWAAGNTAEQASVTATLHLQGPEGAALIVTPQRQTVRLTLDGSHNALETARAAAAEGLYLSIADTGGMIGLDVASAVRGLDAIRRAGVRVVDADPAKIDVTAYATVEVEVTVVAVLPGATVSGDITVDPATVTLRMPRDLRERLPEAITVDAVVDRSLLEQLEAGVMQTQETTIELPGQLEGTETIVTPRRVAVTFKLRSRTATTQVEQVRILIAAPSEDYAQYAIDLPRRMLRSITIEADVDVIAQIEAGDAMVFAVVRLASRDLEGGIEQATVTAFLAIADDGTSVPVTARGVDVADLAVDVQITPMADAAAP